MDIDLDKYRPLLMGLMDGELSPEEAADVNEALTRSSLLREEYEKLRETIQSLRQVFRVDVEEIIGVLETGVGVVGSAVFGDKALVLRGIGVFISTEKQHVLEEVSKAWKVLRIVRAADVNVHGSGRLVSLWVRNQHDLQVVVENNGAIVTLIIWTLSDHCTQGVIGLAC